MKVLVLVLQALKSVLEPIPGWDNVQEQSHTHSPVPCKQQEYKQQQQHATSKHNLLSTSKFTDHGTACEHK